ncbi:MAG: PAS domain S-box protein [Desulfobacterales bacterium]|nr:PAS domain S-box protein [Desulfobacterales bacterium]
MMKGFGNFPAFFTTTGEERPEVLAVRLHLINNLFRIVLGLGAISILLGCFRTYLQGQWIYLSFYISIYCLMLAITLSKERFSFRLKSFFLTGSMFIISTVNFTQVGLGGVGMQIMIATCVLAAVLIGIRAGFLMLGMGLTAVSVAAAAVTLGGIPISPEFMTTSTSKLAWCNAIVTFVMVTTGLILAPHMFVSRLKESLALQEKQSARHKRSNSILRNQIRTRKGAERALFEERKRTENVLQESDGQFQLIYHVIPDPVTIIRERDGICLDVNAQFVSETGWTREEVIGKRFKSLRMWHRSQDKERMAESISRTGRVDNLEAMFRLKNGQIATTLLSAVALTLGGERVIVSVTRDITERNRAQKALKESEEKYRFVVDNTNEWIVLTQNDKVVFANRQAIEQSGYSLEELSKRSLDTLIHPDDVEDAIMQYRSKLEGNPGRGDYEFRIVCKTGNVLWVRINSFPVKWMGEPALLTFMNDISKQKAVEEEKEKLQARLQRAQKMEAIGALAGGVAHDLNNILSGIVSYPDLLLMQLPDDSPLRKPVTTMRESGKRASAVVQDLLTLARRGLAVTEPVNINTVISEFLRSAEFEKICSMNPQVRVETRLGRDLQNMSGSPVHLQKTLMNLVLNAFEAMPDGGAVCISTEKRHLDKSLNGYDRVQEGEYVMLMVSDTGIGISPEERERIFEPFYTNKVMGRSGTGLGMAVVWGTVKDHNGYIDVESTKGKGTAFMLYFPACQEVPRSKIVVSMEHYRGKGESVLVIDDMEDQREIASTLLGRLGYSVIAVSSGEEAVHRVAQKEVDLLVLDMILGGKMDGLDTYREIIKICPSQKAILASGYSETARVKEAQRLGAGQYIRKPYTLERIGIAVRCELDRRETIAA